MKSANQKAWKRNELDFAKWISDWTGSTHRRNDAVHNAGDPARNSDVDAEHEQLKLSCWNGITAELTRRSQGLRSLYDWEKTARLNSKKPAFIIVNGRWAVCNKDTFRYFYETMQRDWDYVGREYVGLTFDIVQNLNVLHVDTKRRLSIIESKSEQSLRYAENKNLFPIVVVREPKRHQLVIFDIDYMYKNLYKTLYGKDPS